MVYPLSQHIGAPANPVVKKGDHVLKGQMIAEAGGFVSAPVYSSVSGTVKGLEQRFNPTGSKTECIVIENDGEYQETEYEPVKPLNEMTREEIKIRFYPNNPMTISNNRKLYPGCNPRKISNIQRDILYPHINRNSPPQLQT